MSNSYYVPLYALCSTPENAMQVQGILLGRDDTPNIVEVQIVKTAWTNEDRTAVERVIDYINNTMSSRFKFSETNAGCKLIRSAYHECLGEVNEDETTAENKLYSVIDWCHSNWFRDPKMRKYCTPSGMFRKSKWQDRAAQAAKPAPGDW